MKTGVDEEGYVESDLWLDQPNWRDEINSRRQAGRLTAEEAQQLGNFAEQGFCRFSLSGCEAAIDSLVHGIGSLWEQRPQDLLAASVGFNGGRPTSIVDFPADFKRGAGLRLLDAHAHNDGARALYLNRKLHRMMGLILDSVPVATQTLLFEYGSGQSLHRDPWYVVTRPISRLVAAWIALEDIHPDSGPLTYVPGSHRLPYYRFRDGGVVMHAPGVSTEDKSRAMAHMQDAMRDQGLHAHPFEAKRGDVFIWHGSLVHGGSQVRNPAKTRKSLVIHFDELQLHPRRGTTVENAEGQQRFYTDMVMHERGAYGFDSPLRDRSLVRHGELAKSLLASSSEIGK